LGLVLVLLIALRWVYAQASRRFTVPLSETMKAADALASGDLSARVPEQGDGEFRRFAHSFNEMAEALEAADRQRRELLADVAHELRTPLTIIQGNLEGLRDGVYDPSPDHLDLVLDETRNLSRLVEDLRLLALAEAGQLRMKPEMLDVRQLLVDVRDAFTAQVDEAGISLAVEVSSPVPPLHADPQRLGQVLGNLLANSLQHTPSGGLVTLGAEADSEWREVQLWVADTGEGIPAEDLPYLFDRFYRTDKSRTRSTGGAGLGLPIARQLVRAHGGRIGVESQLGQGTRFTVALPVAGD
jgi:two-component system OmpR family sensor kinase/two-component system sensor histidine kinase BaeS